MPTPSFEESRIGEMLNASIARSGPLLSGETSGTACGTMVAMVQFEIIGLLRVAKTPPERAKQIKDSFDLMVFALKPGLLAPASLAESQFRKDFYSAKKAFAADLSDIVNGRGE